MFVELTLPIISTIIIPTVAIVVSILLAYKPEHIPFKLIRHNSRAEEPFESNTAIEISHPDRSIEKCKVYINNQELVCEDSKVNSVTILAQGSALFRIPLQLENDNAIVTVKNGRHILRKEKLKDLERLERNFVVEKL